MIINHQKPDFLGRMFLGRGLGFWMEKSPPVNLLDSRCLKDKNQWIVLAALIERAKHGDFEHINLIFSSLRTPDGSAAFWDACAVTLAYAAPSSVLRQLVEEFRSEIWKEKDLWIAEYVVDILYESLQLWTVPNLLDIFLEIGDIEEINEDSNEPSLILVPYYLSTLLEQGSNVIADAELSNSDYYNLVNRLYQERLHEIGSPEALIFNGKLLSVRSLAEGLLEDIINNEDPLDIAQKRMLFEATTGVDCRDFFHDFKLQSLAASAILEDFLESSEADKYDLGVRYFFGHAIPN